MKDREKKPTPPASVSLEEQLRIIIAQAVEAMPKASATDLTNWTRKHELIALMERYDKAQPGITVAEALGLQAARRGGIGRHESSKLG
jgi:hypothetical protein